MIWKNGQVSLLPRHLGDFVNGEALFLELVADVRMVSIDREAPCDVLVEFLVPEVMPEEPDPVEFQGGGDDFLFLHFFWNDLKIFY